LTISVLCIGAFHLIASIRAEIDDSPSSPGEKFYFWEMKGVPLRLEIGPRDYQNNTVSFPDFSFYLARVLVWFLVASTSTGPHVARLPLRAG